MTGGKVNHNGLRFFPIRRDLQNSRPAQAAMGNQHLLAKLLRAKRGNHLGRDARQIAIVPAVLSIQGKRHKRRTALANLQPELPGKFIAEARSAHLRDRESSSSNYQCGSAEFVLLGKYTESCI